jgi:hypothetical protein
VAVGAGVRIDNDNPTNAGATYTVTAPNGYIGALYAFASGTGGTAAADTRGGVQGVGGVTTTYYVGAAGSTAFTTPNSCDLTGLVAGTTGASLSNTTTTSADQAKVVVADALGNKICADVPSSFATGLFGVDKIAPQLALTAGTTAQTAATDAVDATGYNVSKNFTFVYSDTISGFNPATPLSGTLTRKFFAAGSGAAVDCVIGTYAATPKTCSAVPMAGQIEFTGSTSVIGYYRVTANAVDQAGNVSGAVTRIAAFDNVAPTAAAAALAANVVPLGAASITSAAADAFDLSGSLGNLIYPALATFADVAGTSFGPNFDATLVTSGTATVGLTNVYRGLQDGSTGTIGAGAVLPTGTVTVTDVGRNSVTSAPVTITTTTASTPVWGGLNDALTATSLAPATSQGSTTLTFTISGPAANVPFQSQPFDHIDIYKNVGGKLVYVSTNSVIPSNTTTGAGVRTYTYTSPGVALSAASTNTFVAIAVTAAGDAVLSPSVAIVNP